MDLRALQRQLWALEHPEARFYMKEQRAGYFDLRFDDDNEVLYLLSAAPEVSIE